MELASALNPGLARIVALSLLGIAREADYVVTWGDGRGWEKYNVVAEGAVQFAELVNRVFPYQDYYSRNEWADYFDGFFADPPDDFEWPAAAAWLVMWTARLNAGFRGELASMAMAMDETQEAVGAESAVEEDYHERSDMVAPSGNTISVLT